MNTTFVKSDKPLFKTNFNPVKQINIAMRHNEGNLLYLLDSIIHFMMVQEVYGELIHSKKYFRFELKKLMKDLDANIEPIVRRDYETVYYNGEQTTLNLISEFEIFVRYIALNKVPAKELLQDMVKAFNDNTKLIGSIAKKVVKADEREQKPLSKEEQEYLYLLDYTVNLVFLEKYLGQIKETHYDTLVLKQKINSVLEALRPKLDQDYHLVFKNQEKQDLIAFYRDWTSFLGKTKIDQKIVVSQLIEAWNIDKKSIEGAVTKALK